ncbi:MAG: GDSL-type esterase/lipase family protein [Desulfuromonadales bacterium]|jgi:lysophospholipase L1-like esterase
MTMKKILLNTTLVVISLLVALGACELILVATGWSPQKTTSEYLQFGYSTGVPIWDEDGLLEEARPVKVKLFQYDPELFWTTIPGTDFTNRQGFRGAQDVTVANPEDAIRFLILGDSCSFLGRTLYADVLQQQLSRQHPDRRFEIINAAVPGYTTFQGKKVLPRLMPYQPDYACIYFGWNDHWILPSGYSDRFHYQLIHTFKVAQLARILWARLLDMRDYRVPLDDFRANLEAMVAMLKDNGVVPILIKAPAGYGAQGMPRWAYDFYAEYYRMTADEIRAIPETHAAYAQVVADVAEETGAILVDAERSFRQLSPAIKTFFRNDLIHLTEQGHRAMAGAILKQIESDAPPID